MLKFFFYFLLFIGFYHILHTVIVFWIFDGEISLLFSIIKELIWFFFVLILVLFNFRLFVKFLYQNLFLTILLLLLLFYSIFLSLLININLHNLIIGFKYSIYYFFIFFSSVFIWYIVYKKNIYLMKYNKLFFYFIIFLLWLWIIFQFWKNILPNFYYFIWYWAIWDFIQWENPPIYYRTWAWWIQRMSWIFSWPNNLWYMLVLFFWFISYFLLKKCKNRLLYIWIYLFNLIFTMSRWAIVWVIFQIPFLLRYFKEKLLFINKKFIIISVFIWMIWFLSLFFIKKDSTYEHFKRTFSNIDVFYEKPFWYWLWSSWPSAHYNNTDLIPENIHIQILIDIWFIWYIFWISIFLYIIHKSYIIFLKNKSEISNITFILSIWLFWLLFEWIFLHVFEDSMVNYLFFVIFWINYWYITFVYNENKLQKNIDNNPHTI